MIIPVADSLPARNASALEYRARLLAGDFTAEEGIGRWFELLRALGEPLGAPLETFEEGALAAAADVDRRLAEGEAARPLEGIPFTAKGNICTSEGVTSAASRILEGFRSPRDATAVARLRAAGAILTGKTNLDEFGMGSSCENSALQITRNPWDRARVPGGSSGGAAALAGCLGWGFHIGSDTGGSIRQPAAFCGVTGMKPSYGLVSRSGLLAFGSSLDQIGPLGRTAADAAAVLAEMAGEDPLDSTTRPGRPRELLDGEPPRRVGIPREYFEGGIAPEVVARVRDAIAVLEREGIAVEEISLPHTAYANACYQVISTAEASSNLARYDGVHHGVRHGGDGELVDLYAESRGRGFGAEVRRRILLGTFVLSAGYYDAYFKLALRVRRRIREDFEQAFRVVGALLCPTSPVAPFPIGEKVTDPLALYACDVLTVSANLAGIPAISVPCGLTGERLPVGLQLLGPAGEDGALLALSRLYQERTDHHRRLPEGVAGDA
ncbi:MAG: Asp-tRNA(Asn)/Glu-tRNA(Gln) amidotransferase subunit GatA [Planctomycetota bacterium]